MHTMQRPKRPPLGEDGSPRGEGSSPLGEDGSPRGEDSSPVAEDSAPRGVLCRLGKAVLVPVLLFVWLGTPAVGADGPEAPWLSMAFSYERWDLDTGGGREAFGQTCGELAFEYPELARGLRARAYLPLFWTRDGEADATLSGLGDAQVRFQYQPGRSTWRYTAGLDLPTGRTGLDETEARVAARAMASRVLDLRLKRPGEGLDLFGGLSWGLPAGRNTALGVAVAGYVKGAYDLYTTAEGATVEADPGERLHLSLRLLAREHDQDPNWTFRAMLSGQLATPTEIEREGTTAEVREGAQLTAEAAYDRRLGDAARGGVTFYALARDANESDEALVVAEETLGLSTRWVSELGLFYTRPLFGTRARVAVIHTVYRMDASRGVNSRMTALVVESRRPLSPRLELASEIELGVGKTPWAGATAGDWEKRTLSGFGLRLQGIYRWGAE